MLELLDCQFKGEVEDWAVLKRVTYSRFNKFYIFMLWNLFAFCFISLNASFGIWPLILIYPKAINRYPISLDPLQEQWKDSIWSHFVVILALLQLNLTLCSRIFGYDEEDGNKFKPR